MPSSASTPSATRNNAFSFRLLAYFFDRGTFLREPLAARPSRALTALLKLGKTPQQVAEMEALIAGLPLDEGDLAFYQQLFNGGKAIVVHLSGRKTLVIRDRGLIKKTLRNSPEHFAPSATQKIGMQEFQPDAVAATPPGPDFRPRRTANEETLQSSARAHAGCAMYLEKLRQAVDRLKGNSGTLRWGELDAMCKEIALEIIWGTHDPRVYAALDELMRTANLVPPRLIVLAHFVAAANGDEVAGKKMFAAAEERFIQHSPQPFKRRAISLRDELTGERKAFIDTIIRRLGDAPAGSLVDMLGQHVQAGHLSLDDAASQVPHWLFAMRGTLGVHTAYTLALLAVHPDIQAAVYDEVAASGSVSAFHGTLAAGTDVGKYDLLERAVLEAGRLFPAVPMVLREVVSWPTDSDDFRDALPSGVSLEDIEQILILNVANHRDEDLVGPAPATFDPQRWKSRKGAELPHVISGHFGAPLFSGGDKECPGRNLALVLIKAIVGQVLLRFQITGVENSVPGQPWLDPHRIPLSFEQFGITLAVTPRD